MATAPANDVLGLLRPAGTLDVRTALQPYAGPWTQRDAAHLLRRAGFGGTAPEIDGAHARGMHASVDALMDLPTPAGAPPELRFANGPALRRALPDGERLKELSDPQRRGLLKTIRKDDVHAVLGLQRWWLNRMLETPAPLQERMTYYFSGHFTTAAIQKGVDAAMVANQNDLFRRFALGNLRELAWQVSIDPAMLIYLDNASNVAAHPNENYAREVMELFTLGVDQFSEDDVREAARAWTGWTVNRLTGRARFVPRRHDDGVKTLLGRTGRLNGRDVIETIFAQPACARFFASRLLNAFVYNAPEPELVDALAQRIHASDYELRPVLSTLFRSNVFYSPRAYRALVKSPVELAIGAYKMLGATQVDPVLPRVLRQMGESLFMPPNVSGWHGGMNWMTTGAVIARENFMAALLHRHGLESAPWASQIPSDPAPRAQAIAQAALHGDGSAQLCANIAAYAAKQPGDTGGMLYLAAATPVYQLG